MGSVRAEGCWKTYTEGSSDEVASQETVMVGLHFEGLNESRGCDKKFFLLTLLRNSGQMITMQVHRQLGSLRLV